MRNNLEIFRREYLHANTWAQRKEGVPLDLLDKLSAEELLHAEEDLIAVASVGDTWPIMGLGHIKSEKALPKLYELLSKSDKNIKVTIAHAIFQICSDPEMIEIVLKEVPKINDWYQMIDILYLLPDFKDSRITHLIEELAHHSEYLIAYNATRVLGRSTNDVVKRFRDKNE